MTVGRTQYITSEPGYPRHGSLIYRAFCLNDIRAALQPRGNRVSPLFL